METKHDVIVNNKRGVQFKFTVYRKFTIIRGDSATGKTTLFQMVSDAASSRMSGVTVSCDVPVRPLNESGYLRELQEESGRIYVIDEDFGPLKSMEFAKAATISDNCFLIITRESLSAIPYSYKEIYGIKSSGKFHSLERIFPDYETLRDADAIVTEDEDSGYEYYKTYFGSKVSSSKGNSNLSKYGSDNTLLIGDGCAIGAYIQDLLLTGADLYLPESFEWLILNSGLIEEKNVRNILEQPENFIDSREFLSWERFFTKLLMDVTKESYLQYRKAKLNKAYLHEKSKKCILQVVKGISLEKQWSESSDPMSNPKPDDRIE